VLLGGACTGGQQWRSRARRAREPARRARLPGRSRAAGLLRPAGTPTVEDGGRNEIGAGGGR